MNKEVTVAAIQMESTTGDKEGNFSKAENYIRKAASEKAQVICLPELFLTGYRLQKDEFFAISETVQGNMAQKMRDLSAELGLFLIAPFPEYCEDTKKLYNAALVIHNGMILGVHRKIYLWGDQEKAIFSPGIECQPFKSPWGGIGILICADAEFPEPPRMLATGGAEMTFVPSVWSMKARSRWDIFLPAAALSNLYYVIGVNTIGSGVRGGNCGNSKVVDPYGTVLGEASIDQEEVLVDTLDMGKVKAARMDLPYMKDLKHSISVKKS